MSINAGLFRNAQPLSLEQIAQLEDKVLAENGIMFYLEPGGKIRLISSQPLDFDVRQIAWHKLNVLTTQKDIEVKQEYDRLTKEKWLLDLTYNRQQDETEWRPVGENTSAILGRALLGKMILGRRY